MGQADPISRHGVAPASPSACELPDESPIRTAIERRDHRAAIALIDETYGSVLYRFVRNLVGSDDRADDVYQVTLVEAFRDLGGFAGRSSIKSWLFAIARHRCLDALKRDRRRDARFASSTDAPEPADDAPRADQQLSDEQVLAALEHCLGELAPEARMVLLMRFQEGFSYDEISRICRASNETVRARVSRTLPLLRRCIQEHGR